MTENQKREVILILPYLKVNATAAERFKSFICAFQNDPRVCLTIYQVKYPHTKSYFSGMDVDNVDDYPANDLKINYISPRLNRIQKFGFQSLEMGNKFFWKVAHLLHLVMYKSDIFYPGDLNHLQPNKQHQGYVIVSGAHFSYFYSALRLAKNLGYKLIIDYRDPWTFGYPPIGGIRILHKLKVLINRRKELEILKHADLITTVSASLRQFFPKVIIDKVIVTPNGSNFEVKDTVSSSSPRTFNILYAGTIYNIQLENEVFFKALADFMKNKDQSKVKLQFIGSARHAVLNKILIKYKLQTFVQMSPRVKRKELMTYLNDASVFLQLKLGDNKSIITSKLADYLAFRKPILLPVSDNGDIAESIIMNNAGYVCNTVEENIAVLESLYQKFKKGESLVVPQSEEMLLKNSRSYIAKEFVDQVLKV